MRQKQTTAMRAGTAAAVLLAITLLGASPLLAQANDDCADALWVQCGSVMAENTAGANGETLGFCGTTDGTAGGVWYRLAGDGDTYTVSTCDPDTNYDTKIRVYSGSCGALTCVDGNDDDCGLLSTVTFATTPGIDYFILVHGFDSFTGDFVLHVDSAGPCNPTPAVDLFVADTFDFMWNDSGTGGNVEGSFWNPSIPAPQQSSVFSFGSTARPDYGTPTSMIVASELIGPALAAPIGYDLIWTDSGSGGNFNGCFYNPVPPPGYVILSSLATNCAPPSAFTTVCVRSDLVVRGSIGNQIYNDGGTGSNSDFAAWDIEAPAGAIDIGGFIGVPNYNVPTQTVWCLRADVVQQAPAPSASTLDFLIANFGPIFQFHSSEIYMPDDPAAVLDHPSTTVLHSTLINAGVYGSFMETELGNVATSAATVIDDMQTALDHPNAANGDFHSRIDYDKPALQLGNLGAAEAYVRVQPLDGVITELQFWLFYPWNGPGQAELGCSGVIDTYDPTDNVGSHYSDWENVRVRVTNKSLSTPGGYELVNVVMSRHATEETAAPADLQYQSGRPLIYVAKDSHAHYRFADTHYYDRPYSKDIGFCTLFLDLFDQTNNGGPQLDTALPGRSQIVSSAWPEVVTDTPDWFFFPGQWGGFEQNEFSVDYLVYSHTEQEVSNGKPGLLRRNEFATAIDENANLGLLRVSDGTLVPSFSPQTTNYDLTLDSSVTSLSFIALAADHESMVEISFDGTTETLENGARLGLGSDPFPVPPMGGPVTITVTTRSGVTQTTTINVNVFQAAPGDECSDPLLASVGSNAIDTTGMTDSAEATDDSLCPGVFLGDFVQDAWYEFTAPSANDYTFSTCGLVDFDTDLAVYSDSCGALTLLACSGDGVGCPDFSSEIVDLSLTAGQTVLVRVGGWELGEAGMGTLEISTPMVGATFLRGDANEDGGANIADAIGILGFLFSGETLTCLDAADVNDDGMNNIADPISLLDFLFSGGPPPPAPFPMAGTDPTADSLGCP